MKRTCAAFCVVATCSAYRRWLSFERPNISTYWYPVNAHIGQERGLPNITSWNATLSVLNASDCETTETLYETSALTHYYNVTSTNFFASTSINILESTNISYVLDTVLTTFVEQLSSADTILTTTTRNDTLLSHSFPTTAAVDATVKSVNSSTTFVSPTGYGTSVQTSSYASSQASMTSIFTSDILAPPYVTALITVTMITGSLNGTPFTIPVSNGTDSSLLKPETILSSVYAPSSLTVNYTTAYNNTMTSITQLTSGSIAYTVPRSSHLDTSTTTAFIPAIPSIAVSNPILTLSDQNNITSFLFQATNATVYTATSRLQYSAFVSNGSYKTSFFESNSSSPQLISYLTTSAPIKTTLQISPIETLNPDSTETAVTNRLTTAGNPTSSPNIDTSSSAISTTTQIGDAVIQFQAVLGRQPDNTPIALLLVFLAIIW